MSALSTCISTAGEETVEYFGTSALFKPSITPITFDCSDHFDKEVLRSMEEISIPPGMEKFYGAKICTHVKRI